MNGLLLKAEDAARLLKLSRSKVYGMLQRGELPCVKIGRSVRVPEDALSTWLALQCPNARPAPTTSWHVDIEALLQTVGLDNVEQGATAKQIAPAIVRFADAMKDANPLIRHVAREEVIHRLTTAGVRTPSHLLALAFGEER